MMWSDPSNIIFAGASNEAPFLFFQQGKAKQTRKENERQKKNKFLTNEVLSGNILESPRGDSEQQKSNQLKEI